MVTARLATGYDDDGDDDGGGVVGDGIRWRWRTKTSREGTKMSCDGLTLGKIIFGYTPVLPPQQTFSNATMEQVQRWGEDVSNDGLDAISAN